jgi:hypothetical protein
MLFRASRRLVVCLCGAVALASPAAAQQRPQNPPKDGVSCDAFVKNADGDWVAKRDVMVPGAGVMVQIKAGQPVDDELQQQFDDRCK